MHLVGEKMENDANIMSSLGLGGINGTGHTQEYALKRDPLKKKKTDS